MPSLPSIPPQGQGPNAASSEAQNITKATIIRFAPDKTQEITSGMIPPSMPLGERKPTYQLKTEFTSLDNKVKDLVKNRESFSPIEWQEKISETREDFALQQRRINLLGDTLDQMEFEAEHGIVGELDPNRPGSFASNLMEIAESAGEE